VPGKTAEEIADSVRELHDVDMLIAELIEACAASGRWPTLRPRLLELVKVRLRLAQMTAELYDTLLAEDTLH